MDTKEIKDTIVVAGPPKQKPNVEEIKDTIVVAEPLKQKPNVEEVQDTIVVAWPPGHQPNDEDRAVAPRIIPAPPTMLASTGTSSKKPPQSTPKRALRRTCGF
ncbi:hypothetical protein Daus18300_006338 [Diaporthe australafricana]|uniref:Uncharacterized protein n=1 Tax=Diaporthe australafricana TaxID=127596 RepID=A0ABR3WVJ8_9PEZI